MAELRRSLLTLTDAAGNTARLGFLNTGQVSLRVNDDPATALVTDTLEDLLLLSAASPHLNAELYAQLHWELDLLGLRGG